MIPIAVEGPFDMVAIDAVGPLPVTNRGNRYVLVISDYLTRYVEAVAVENITAETTACVLFDEVILGQSARRVIFSDQGRNFTSKLVQEL